MRRLLPDSVVDGPETERERAERHERERLESHERHERERIQEHERHERERREEEPLARGDGSG